ncbi:MAG: DNA polymerase I [Deltaproteobacteria bacterium]|nr:DNA polymerase I [Deltaproteobacteria bacterium]
MSESKAIYLVDGSSYIHRAYHAIRNLANSSGLPTNAVYGFVRMLLKLMKDETPEYLAVVFDAKGKTFRHHIYEDYKANRPPAPDDLVAQIPYIKRIVRGLNVKMLEKEGFEADDLIGTLARRAGEQGCRVVVVTGDKDFRQIVSPQISLWDSMRDKTTDYEAFKSGYEGLEPGQIVDLMGLAGDSSDNIPGVRGVGEKTALTLIREHGSMEGVYEDLDGIKQKKLKENLTRYREEAFLSRRLVTIDCHVPLEVGLEDLEVGDPDAEDLAVVFQELEFRELWDQFAPETNTCSRNVRLCSAEEALEDLVREIREAGRVSLDTETTSRNPHEADLVGISFSCREGSAAYVPVGHEGLGPDRQVTWDCAREILRSVLEDPAVEKIGQNIKYDALVFRRHGVDLQGIRFDTMVASYVINPGLRQHNLDALAQHYFNIRTIAYHDVVGRGKQEIPFSRVSPERASEYACEDAEVTLRLMEVLGRQLEEDGNHELFFNLEMPLLPVLVDMEAAGVRVDADVFRRMSERFCDELERIQAAIFEEAGMEFNLNSPQQLGFVLFEKLGLPTQGKTSKTRAYATDIRALRKLAAMAFRIPEMLLTYRSLAKLKSTYLDALVKMINPETGRIHTSFNQAVAATGRLSSSNPNLQNIPIRSPEGRDIRKGFVAEPGHLLLSADYSQIELRVFAHYSGDPALIEAFQRDEDVHERTARELFEPEEGRPTPEMRRVAKTINFGIIYGMGANKLGDQLGVDYKTAKGYIEAYYRKHEGVLRFREAMIERARKEGYVTTLFNRRRYLPDIHHKNHFVRGEAERMAVNTPIQGTAADLIKKAMIRIHRRLEEEGLEAGMILQVHDELVFELPEGELDTVRRLVCDEMEGVHELDVPLKVDMGTGRNWAEAH